MSVDFDRATERAHATEEWGPYTIVIVRIAARVQKGVQVISIDPYRTRPFKRRVPVSWVASAWLDGEKAYGVKPASGRTRAAACAALRVQMRKRYDALPRAIERLEAEIERLREALL